MAKYEVFQKRDGEPDALVRAYSTEKHGEEAAALAEEFAKKNEAKGFYVKSEKKAKKEEAPAPSSDASGSAGGNGGSPESYSDLTVPDLKKECEARKIEVPQGAKKADLVALLEKWDEENPDA